eukprot:9214838-Pyramimonas_sp.AAC.1
MGKRPRPSRRRRRTYGTSSDVKTPTATGPPWEKHLDSLEQGSTLLIVAGPPCNNLSTAGAHAGRD